MSAAVVHSIFAEKHGVSIYALPVGDIAIIIKCKVPRIAMTMCRVPRVGVGGENSLKLFRKYMQIEISINAERARAWYAVRMIVFVGIIRPL